MGRFCTTSFGGDAFQMGNMESVFILLLSPASGSVINSMTVSLCRYTQAAAHSCSCTRTLKSNSEWYGSNTFPHVCVAAHIQTYRHILHHLNIHLNAAVELNTH